MKILVVEDDQAVAQTLQILLSHYHYAVDIAEDGEVGMQMVSAFDYDLILLDISLPGLDGLSLCKQLRAQGDLTPILLLTGLSGAQQKAIALNAGADDYVVKPFDPDELIARVQALLRRGGASTQPTLSWGQLSLQPDNHQVTYDTELLTVTPKEYAILELLLRYPQEIFNARAILDQAWSSVEAPGEEAIRRHIKELRKKLKAVGAPADFIKTVYGLGYRLNPIYALAQVSPADESLTMSQIAELKAVNQKLRVKLEELQATQAELKQKHQKLKRAYQAIEQKNQQSQGEQNKLEE